MAGLHDTRVLRVRRRLRNRAARVSKRVRLWNRIHVVLFTNHRRTNLNRGRAALLRSRLPLIHACPPSPPSHPSPNDSTAHSILAND